MLALFHFLFSFLSFHKYLAFLPLGKANTAIRPHLIDLPTEDLYKIITDTHESVVEAILPQLPKARPRQHWFNSHCMRLIDCRNEARQCGASEDEVLMITLDINRECRKAKNEVLRAAVIENDWVRIGKLKRFRTQQARIKDSNGKVQPAGQRAQTIAEYFQNVQWASADLDDLPDRPPLHPQAEILEHAFTADELRAA